MSTKVTLLRRKLIMELFSHSNRIQVIHPKNLREEMLELSFK